MPGFGRGMKRRIRSREPEGAEDSIWDASIVLPTALASATCVALDAILQQYTLRVRGMHGVVHWARVLENGLRLAEATGADPEVVTWLALFHDAGRVSEGDDPDRGRVGGELAWAHNETVLKLDDRRFERLYEACRLHTDGLTEAEPTIQACWDADRLDLGRVGILPEPRRLFSDPARGLIDWSDERACRNHEPAIVRRLWGC